MIHFLVQLPVIGGVDSMSLFHNYIEVWVEDKQLHLLDLCKSEKVPWSGLSTNHSMSPFAHAEDMYEKIKDTLHEYDVVINRWPQYSLLLENAVINVGRAIIKALERQYSDILNPLNSVKKQSGEIDGAMLRNLKMDLIDKFSQGLDWTYVESDCRV